MKPAPEDIDDRPANYRVKLGHLQALVRAKSPLHALELARQQFITEWPTFYTDISQKEWDEFSIEFLND